ncbi:MAG: bifunctional (p)ppGpp synthetase/guanosine-3',5'-bis(diphosphate) 3'-pyrophosphohydrolase [Chitinophagales bacterium]|nr:bifunctional (p)ppGpp synthetase/guanosine-3',5'-bis(diphosphate) 3'-pyrophosphohydrolase [Chitinophagales bacterium]
MKLTHVVVAPEVSGTSIKDHEKKGILQQYRRLFHALKPQLQKGDRKMIRLAFEIAYDAHKDIRRKSGEPYILHPLAVAQIVASEIGLGAVGVMCALLHDTVEDTEVTLEDIEREFGKAVAEIIDGLTKISVIFDVHGFIQAENIRKIMLTLSKDVRVILIKLADRLHNMRTMDSMPRAKQIKIASETIYLYVPLAHRLGLFELKSELEDLSMKYSEPKIYKQIADKIIESKKERNHLIAEFIKPIKEELTAQNFQFQMYGRLKTVYSIWRKMREQGVPFEEVYDKFAIRIIIRTDSENEKTNCWRVYSIVTDCYRPNPDRLRDWISNPKANGYEALHTTVMGPEGNWVEVQVRTERMNEIAEKGYAAHFKYKEKQTSDSSIDDWIKKIRELLENPATNTLDFIDDFKLNLFAEEIYVFTPRGQLKILPLKSSVLDMAFEIHSDIGQRCIGAKVNHKIVPLSYQLINGDQVEVLTSKKQKPAEEWLKYVVTAKAKSGIKDVLKSERRRLVEIGKKALEEIFKQRKVSFNSHNLNKVLDYFKIPAVNNLYYSIGVGNFKFSDMDNFVRVGDNIELKDQTKTTDQNVELAIKNKLVSNASLFAFGDGAETVDYNLAGCCKPIPGDDVFGYVNKNKEIEIHRTNCPKAINAISKYGYDIVRTKWTKQHQIAFLTGLKLTGIDDVGAMYKITNVISGDLKVNMQSITIDTKDGIFEGIIKVFVKDTFHLTDLVDKLRQLDGILSVARYEDQSVTA